MIRFEIYILQKNCSIFQNMVLEYWLAPSDEPESDPFYRKAQQFMRISNTAERKAINVQNSFVSG